MNVLANGKYTIVPGTDTKTLIGADNIDDCAAKPVVIGGQMKTWTMESFDDGTIKLILEESWYSTNDGDKVVVQTSVDPGTRWTLFATRGVGPLILSTDMKMAWTATGTESKDLVVLRPTNAQDPSQVWNFVPVTSHD
ncbi:hypothetical protein EV363DRAFT_1168864 [Boletus edulis]|nr:hypothetical protein EV363DRAFT_1168864 [Boletus edulis]